MPVRTCLCALVLCVACVFARAQQAAAIMDSNPPSSEPEKSEPAKTTEPTKTTLASGIQRVAGIDSSSGIQYLRLILVGSLPSASSTSAPTAGGSAPQADSPPLFIAQCSLRPGGKHLFEVFTSFGDRVDLAFYPPWKPASADDLFPPRTDKRTISMEFLGYTKVKPFRRQWEIPIQTPGLFHYNPPGAGSPNLEEFSYFLRYLLALPTLRLTLEAPHSARVAQFSTPPLLAAIRAEPVCQAAGLQ